MDMPSNSCPGYGYTDIAPIALGQTPDYRDLQPCIYTGAQQAEQNHQELGISHSNSQSLVLQDERADV